MAVTYQELRAEGRAYNQVEESIRAQEEKLATIRSREARRSRKGQATTGTSARAAEIEASIASLRAQRDSVKASVGDEYYRAALSSRPRDYNTARASGFSRSTLQQQRASVSTQYMASRPNFSDAQQGPVRTGFALPQPKTEKPTLVSMQEPKTNFFGEGFARQNETKIQQQRIRNAEMRGFASANPVFQKTVLNPKNTGEGARNPFTKEGGYTPVPQSRPQYSSAYGFSTPGGYGENFYLTPKQKEQVPTFAKQRSDNTKRLFDALEQGKGREAFEATAKPFVEVPGLAVEKTGNKIAQFGTKGPATFFVGENKVGRLTRATGRGVRGFGNYARTNPTGVVRDFAIGAGIGGATRYAVSKTAAGVATGKVGQFAQAKFGRTFGLTTRPGMQGIIQATKFERGTNFVGGGIAATSLGVTGATGGAEAIGRNVPGFAGFGAGYAGLKSANAQQPTLRFLKARRTSEGTSILSGTQYTAKTSGVASARLTAYGVGRNVKAPFSGTFKASALESGSYRGGGSLKATYNLLGKPVVARQSFTGTFSPRQGAFDLRIPTGREYVGSTGKGNAFSSEGSVGRQQSFPTRTFEVLPSGKLGSVRSGAVIADTFGAARQDLKPGGYVSLIDTPKGLRALKGPSLQRTGTDIASISYGRDRGVPKSLGRGNRGRLARGLNLGEQAVGNTPATAFRQTFNPETSYGASLGPSQAQLQMFKSRKGQSRLSQSELARVQPARAKPQESLFETRPLDFGSLPLPKTSARQSLLFLNAPKGASTPRLDQNIFTNTIARTEQRTPTRPKQEPQIIPSYKLTPKQDTTPAIKQEPLLDYSRTGGGRSITIAPPIPLPPTPTGGGFFGLPILIPSGRGSSGIGSMGRGFKYNFDLKSAFGGITSSRAPKGALGGFETRPIIGVTRKRRKRRSKR